MLLLDFEGEMLRRVQANSFAPSLSSLKGLAGHAWSTLGLRPGLRYFAAARLGDEGMGKI